MSQDWFVERIGADVLRGSSRITIRNYDMAVALFELQDDQYKFTDPITIHSSQSTCVACEG